MTAPAKTSRSARAQALRIFRAHVWIPSRDSFDAVEDDKAFAKVCEAWEESGKWSDPETAILSTQLNRDATALTEAEERVFAAFEEQARRFEERAHLIDAGEEVERADPEEPKEAEVERLLSYGSIIRLFAGLARDELNGRGFFAPVNQ